MPYEPDQYADAFSYTRGYADAILDMQSGVKVGARNQVIGQIKVKRPKRKLSAWNKFVKANSKKPRFRLRSGSPNLKKLGIAFRKTPAGKKKRR